MPKVFHSFSGSVIFHCVCVRVCGLVTKLLSTLATPWTVARQTPLSMGFSRRGLPFPSPGDLPNPGIKPGSPALQADSLPAELRGKPKDQVKCPLFFRFFTHVLLRPCPHPSAYPCLFSIYVKFNLNIFCLIYFRAGSSLLHTGFL